MAPMQQARDSCRWVEEGVSDLLEQLATCPAGFRIACEKLAGKVANGDLWDATIFIKASWLPGIQIAIT